MKKKTIQILSKDYFIDSLELTNYFQKKPFYAVKFRDYQNDIEKEINFQTPEKKNIIYGNFEFSCDQKYLELRGYLQSLNDSKKYLYFSMYFNCKLDSILTVKPEGEI